MIARIEIDYERFNADKKVRTVTVEAVVMDHDEDGFVRGSRAVASTRAVSLTHAGELVIMVAQIVAAHLASADLAHQAAKQAEQDT